MLRRFRKLPFQLQSVSFPHHVEDSRRRLGDIRRRVLGSR